jgi:hypothetical protein
MGGTSAGGMTTIIAAIYALKGVINPVKSPDDKHKKKDNLFYDSWVLLGDEDKKPKIFERTFNTSDLDKSGKIQSLLNSDFIDALVDDAFKDGVAQKKKPAYISDQLEIVLSHTMLRSVPLAVNFTTPIGKLRKSHDNPEHNTFDHFTVSHFKLNYDAGQHANKFLPLDPFGATAPLMKLVTKATGAFPVGLRFREFFANELTTAYIQHTAQKIAFDPVTAVAAGDNIKLQWPENFPNPFNFVSVDGGAINNEPFGEVLNILKRRYKIRQADEDYKYALIMIDPFQDLVPVEEYKQPDDLFSVVPAIIGTLYDQAKVKRAEMLDAYSNDYYRGEIFPARYTYDAGQKKYEKAKVGIACSTVMAFGGFLDINFRHHDFFLGRDNARNFFKFYFSFEYSPAENKVHPIHQSWSADMIKHFKFRRDGKDFLPIVPDLYLLRSKLQGAPPNPFKHTVDTWPEYDPEQLFALRDPMQERIKKMLEMTYKKMTSDKAKEKYPETEKWIDRYYRDNFFTRITGWIGSNVLQFLFVTNKGKIANRVTKAAIEWILKDLEKNGLLKKAKR